MSSRALSFAAAFLLVNGLLLGPGWLVAGGPGPRWITLEAVFLVGLFALLPRGGAVLVGRVAATAVVFLAALAVADSALRLSLGRPLSLYLDAHLMSSVHHLLAGAVGPVLAVVALAAMALLTLALTLVLARLLSSLPYRQGTPPLRVAAVALIALVSVGVAGDRLPIVGPRIASAGIDTARQQTSHLVRALRARERFAEESASTPDSYAELPGLLGRLRDTDVLLAFVESYGISALEDERFAGVVRPRLADLAERARQAGLHVATGTLTAPVQGGQSWLAHGSVLSGLWLDSQLRYELLLTSGRETLVDDFRRAGHRTAAVMPAITMAWPEGERFGFDDLFVHRNMGYAGPPLNWVTMPDQYTWSFVAETVRGSERPLFAAIGLISSHAPWTPILPVLEDWESIGDGSVFAAWEDAGERPAELWLDTDRVREHYALSVEYALNAMIGYAERYVDDRTLLIVLGDHQPAPLITGDGASRAVPVHVITGDPELLGPFFDRGFVRGGLPAAGAPAPGMDTFRHWFVGAFSEPVAGHGAR